MRSLVGSLVTMTLVMIPVEGLDARAEAPARQRVPEIGTAARPQAQRASVGKASRAGAPRRQAGQRFSQGQASKRCRARTDLRVPLPYLHGGAVWIPAEARCGGRFPVVVLLHGNNTDKETVKSIGGGRHLDRWARRYLNGKLIEPLVLAEPIHFGACASDERRAGLPYLFTGAFDFKEYRRRLEAALARHGVKARSWSFIGHSGAACCLSMGMFAIKEAWPEILVWGSADGCYSETLQAAAIEQQLGKTRTRVFNACRGYPAYQGYRGYERTLLTRGALTVKCDSTYYKECRRHPSRPWFSFTTQFTGAQKHGKVLEELFKTIVFHQFPSARRVAAAKQAAQRQARLAARRRSRNAPRPRSDAKSRVSRRAQASRGTRAATRSQGQPRPGSTRPAPRAGTVATRDE